jgi:hypothetical protein
VRFERLRGRPPGNKIRGYSINVTETCDTGHFKEEDVETSLMRKEVETLPKEVKNIRNNVDAEIFQ